ncbi:hypothetical protein [Ornithinimicrobium cavernae]|uniref:hypothetical protein n=1 Tax=Ornithinimicrobium cavernae TaxID=2666047 RepID=UPI0012B16ABB|nr:hypothetical protein [Ornithinimicrobium cavernae]
MSAGSTAESARASRPPQAAVTGGPGNGPVPETVAQGEDVVTVERAWPRGDKDGAQILLVEGRDQGGRLRAGRLHLHPAPGAGWRVTRTELTPPAEDPRLPDLADAARGATLVVHRFGRRAVVRRADDYIKVVRPGEGPTIAAAARHGREVARLAGFGAPTVGEVGQGQVSFGILPGRSLHELGGTLTRTDWASWWDLWARRWILLAHHEATGPSRHRPAVHTAQDEVTVLQRWVDRALRLGALPADLHGHVGRRVEAACRALVSGAAQNLVLSHRDLHDKQILAHGDALGLLDFDTVALAEPALDLANLWVHAGLRADQGLWSRGHSELAGDRIREVAAFLEVDESRFEAYAEATRLRLACLYAFRPRHRALALAWAADA